tara:strand:- start:514 stop:795 length:282 start_codon:yes stop_codon:yes gene_type:complete
MTDPKKAFEERMNDFQFRTYTPQFKPGDVVEFTGQTKEQRLWGNNDDAYASDLIVGRHYVVDGVFPHHWHTKLSLRHTTGSFNSVCFALVGEI